MKVTAQGPNSVAAWRRSRVRPGWSSTSASCLPASRLNRVDLPTFGRPTMATVKDIGPFGEKTLSDLVESDQRSVVGENINAASGHNGRDEHRRIVGQLADEMTAPRIGADQQS